MGPPPQGYNLVKTHDGGGAFIVVDADEMDDFSVGAPHRQRTYRCPRGGEDRPRHATGMSPKWLRQQRPTAPRHCA